MVVYVDYDAEILPSVGVAVSLHGRWRDCPTEIKVLLVSEDAQMA
jgi:hypothetical protein